MGWWAETKIELRHEYGSIRSGNTLRPKLNLAGTRKYRPLERRSMTFALSLLFHIKAGSTSIADCLVFDTRELKLICDTSLITHPLVENG